jgi:hypothetical protein
MQAIIFHNLLNKLLKIRICYINHSSLGINLKGIMIGDGYVDP